MAKKADRNGRLDPLDYYPWRWKNFRLSRNAQRLHYIAKGLYRELLDEQWAEGFIPDDLGALSDICGCPLSVINEYWPALERFFPLVAAGQRVNPVQETNRTELDAQRVSASRAGSIAAEHRAAAKEAARLAAERGNSVGEKATTVEAEPSTDKRPLPNFQPEEKRVEEERKEEKSSALTANAVPASRGKLLGTLPLVGRGGDYEVHEDDYVRDHEAYPAVDVKQQYREMKAWLLANPRNRKTAIGIRKFMNAWLAREQDKARVAPTDKPKVAMPDVLAQIKARTAEAEAAIAAEREAQRAE